MILNCFGMSTVMVPDFVCFSFTLLLETKMAMSMGFLHSSLGKESACNVGDPSSIPGLGRSAGKGIGYPLQYSWASGGSAGKASVCSAGDLGWIPGLGRSPGEGKGYPLQYSELENSMDSIVHGVIKTRTQLSDFHFTSLPGEVAYTMWAHNSVMWGQDLMS